MREEVKGILFGTYYCFFLMLAAQILAAAVSYTNRKKFPELKLYHLYSMAGLIQTVMSITNAQFLESKTAYILNQISVNVFLLIEIGLFYSISLRAEKNRLFRSILFACLFSFIIACSYLWATTDSFLYNSEKVYGIETMAMLIPACSYFLGLFRVPASINLFDQPLFWINLGVFVTFFCILPLSMLDYFIKKYLENNADLYYIVFVCYSVNYLFNTRAYLCKRRELSEKSSYPFKRTVFLKKLLAKFN